jgi:hypothetical protein
MDSQTLVGVSCYIAVGVAAWPVCKYVLKPLVEVSLGIRAMESYERSLAMYEKVYDKIIEERARVTVELGKAGKNSNEISDILDTSLPFPESPEEP